MVGAVCYWKDKRTAKVEGCGLDGEKLKGRTGVRPSRYILRLNPTAGLH